MGEIMMFKGNFSLKGDPVNLWTVGTKYVPTVHTAGIKHVPIVQTIVIKCVPTV